MAERKALLNTYFPNEYDPVLGWVLKPNQSIDPDNPAKSITTGEYGVRLSEPGASPSLPQGAILAVGDSFTAGDEVGDRGAWPAILEGILGRRVINAADVGWGTDQIVLRTEELLPKLAPSTVILSVFQDFNGDVDRAGLRVFWSVNKPYFTIEDGALVPHNIPVPQYRGAAEETSKWLLVPSYFYLLQFVVNRLGGWSNWWEMYSFVPVNNDSVAVSCALLHRIQSELAARGTDFLLVMQYTGSVNPVKRPDKSAAVVACARAAGIDTLFSGMISRPRTTTGPSPITSSFGLHTTAIIRSGICGRSAIAWWRSGWRRRWSENIRVPQPPPIRKSRNRRRTA